MANCALARSRGDAELTTLSGKTLRDLLTEGWKCDTYGGLCKVSSHGEKVHKLLYDPDNLLDQETLAKECYRFTSLSLHAARNAGKLAYGKKLTWTKGGKPALPRARERIVVPSATFAFMLTRECVDMPLDVEGELYMAPKVSNLGLLFFTLGHVHSGFHGRLTATVLNMTDREITLEPDETILHFVCHKTSDPVEPHPTHDKPQLTLTEAEANIYFTRTVGFAAASKDFATRDELRHWVAFIGGLALALFAATIAIVVYLLGIPTK